MAENNSTNAGTSAENQDTQPKSPSSKIFPIVLSVVVIVGLFFGIKSYLWGKHHTETDDAQTFGDLAPVVPRVSGYVIKLNVSDNQIVKKGDTLVVLDQKDLAARVEQAEAALANAEANLDVVTANVQTAKLNTQSFENSTKVVSAQILAAKIRANRASQDFDRYANLIKDHSITQQQYDQALADKETAQAQLLAVEKQEGQANSQALSSQAQSRSSVEQIKVAQAQVKQRQADLDLAKLQISYSVITAPENGIISKRSVQLGQFVSAGQTLFTLVLSDKLWIVANFKETQLEKMRPGQGVDVEVDAFPNTKFKGKVESISGGTGAVFALLPPDNSTGNFVKVVQRIPVKILFDESNKDLALLKAGMNVKATVNFDEN
jgi:membrane fusion protein (multidrug efflux system)